MPTLTDRDGKSKTASAVDAEHYPEQNEVPKAQTQPSDGPDIEAIKARAHELWIERGRPHGSADQDWHQAEQEVRAQLHESSGSVQR